PRVKLPAMYTLVRVRRVGDTRYRWTGYVYDISRSGMRFELDDAIEPGAMVQVRVMLPGPSTTMFTATGRVVRLHDDQGEPGPMRMGMTFDRFKSSQDSERLSAYINATAQTPLR